MVEDVVPSMCRQGLDEELVVELVLELLVAGGEVVVQSCEKYKSNVFFLQCIARFLHFLSSIDLVAVCLLSIACYFCDMFFKSNSPLLIKCHGHLIFPFVFVGAILKRLKKVTFGFGIAQN